MKNVIRIILGIVLVIILILILIVAFNATKNIKAMNHCVDSALAQLKQNYTITPRDTGEFKEMKMYGIIKFNVEQYDIAEIGNLSVMRVNMGFMQMATFVITPRDKNLPLLSADYMYILSNRTSYVEIYDLVKEKDEQYMELLTALSQVQSKYEYLKNAEVTPAWYQSLLTVGLYKNSSPEQDSETEQMLLDSLDAFIQHSKQLPLLSEEERAEKLAITIEYSDGLIEKGGISTDVFVQQFGKEKTKAFFDKVFFGTLAE